MRVTPTYTFDNQPRPDILMIPGGGVFKEGGPLNNTKLIKWIQDNAKDAKYVLSVCTGAFLLSKAGLLGGLEATTNAGFIEGLTAAAPKTRIVRDKRVVDNGKIITTAGVSAGIDGALHLVSKLDGEGWAQWVALSIEYNWQPASNYTRANLAEMKLPSGIYDSFLSEAQPVSFKGDTERWEEKWIVTTTKSPKDLMESIDKQWAADKRWSRRKQDLRNNALASFWELYEEKKGTWEGGASVELAGEPARMLITLKISRRKT